MISIGASGFMQAPKREEKSAAFLAGVEARKRTTSLKKTMINQLMVGSRQYYDFIDGFDSGVTGVGKKSKGTAFKCFEGVEK
jgi:hypothetical protein